MELNDNYYPEVRIKKETEVFFEVLENILKFYMDENPDLKIMESCFWGGGKNIELGNHTLSIQHVRSAANPEARSYLNIGLYDLRFDENGKAITKEGVPLRNFEFDEHCIRCQEVEITGRKACRFFWKDRKNDRLRYSTVQLVNEWLKELVTCNDPMQLQNMSKRIYPSMAS
jgi:hypothetical protein